MADAEQQAERFVLVVECESDGSADYPIGVAAEALRERGVFDPRDGVRAVRLHAAVLDSADRVIAALNEAK